FLECVAQGIRALTDGWGGHAVVQVMEAIDRSLERNGAPVEVEHCHDGVAYTVAGEAAQAHNGVTNGVTNGAAQSHDGVANGANGATKGANGANGANGASKGARGANGAASEKSQAQSHDGVVNGAAQGHELIVERTL